MKYRQKWWLALLALLLATAALAEPMAYDLQRDLRVFEADGKVGLMSSDECVLLNADYASIEPFADIDYSIITAQDGRHGVVSRAGELLVPCEWDVVNLYPETRTAVAYSDYTHQTLYDLDTGEIWMQENGVDYTQRGPYVVALNYSGLNFGPEPPYYSRVYDQNRALVWEGAGGVLSVFYNGWIVRREQNETYTALDASWIALVEG